MANGYKRLAIPLSGLDGLTRGWWVIEPESSNLSLEHSECRESPEGLPKGWKGLPSDEAGGAGRAPLQIMRRAGRDYIRLFETQPYEWSVEGLETPSDLALQSSLQNKGNWKHKRAESGSFRVVNHLGLADFSLRSAELLPLELNFEFISRKFDFDSEYRRLTEDIADFCQQLLLSWDAPTRLRFNADPEHTYKLLLEQFLFLKNFMTQDRLSRLLEAIGRNSHSQLIRETSWVPAAAARSGDYLSNPCGMLRDWRRKGGRRIPGEVQDVRKNDTHDTAPNRFIKFALAQFRQICADVCAQRWKEDGKASTLSLEAKEMLDQLDALLARRFFNEVGRMQRLPLDNQTLQKREGYREVLQAWLLTQAATTLNWKSRRDCYEGDTRDVATLYEYWIFIQLHRILQSIEGMRVIKGDPLENVDEFISEADGQLTINLQQGKQSRCAFEWTGCNALLHIDLHYERSFRRKRGATHSGSYSRTFKPDYTLSIYPRSYNCEAEAERDGKVAHLHFDAKYRAEEISSVFGSGDPTEEELSIEKRESKSEQTYKRGDLLKMHTYNDALQHTIGSYVLFPGTKTESAERIPKFYEIAPGVGALVMKPGSESCLETLRNFIVDVFEHQADAFTQYRYIQDTDFQTLQHRPEMLEEPGAAYSIARRDAPCVLLYIPRKNEEDFKKYGYAYCRVENIGSAEPLNLDLSIEVGSEFIPYGGARAEAKQTRGWRGKIRTARFVEKNEARRYLLEKYPETKALPESEECHYYLLFEFDTVRQFKVLNVGPLHKEAEAQSRYMAISCTWDEILSCGEPQSVLTLQ
ncbi:MAG: DUF2357 domain-containing protein [Coraliomargarita sp.]